MACFIMPILVYIHVFYAKIYIEERNRICNLEMEYTVLLYVEEHT